MILPAGLYGDGRDTNVTSRIFGIACALSSHLIFNVHENLSTEDLLNLNLFASLGRLGIGTAEFENCQKPDSSVDLNENFDSKCSKLEPIFQQLTFLVRSWRYPNEFPFGFNEQFIHKNLRSIYSNDCDVIKKTKSAIKDQFDSINCYLMPDPGCNSIYEPNFQGQHGHFTEQFKGHFSEFIESLFEEPNSRIKSIINRQLTCSDLCQVFESIESKQGHFPNVPSIRAAALIAFESVLISDLLDKYDQLIRDQLFLSDKIEPSLDLLHKEIKSKLIKEFHGLNKITTVDEDRDLENKLVKKLDQKFFIILGN